MAYTPLSAAPSSAPAKGAAYVPLSSSAAPSIPAPAPASTSYVPLVSGGASNAMKPSTPAPVSPTPNAASTPAKAAGPYVPALTKDTSGKPLLGFDGPQFSTILPDRVYPGFDPTKPQKLDQSALTNGRMPEAVSQPIKAQMGGSYSD